MFSSSRLKGCVALLLVSLASWTSAAPVIIPSPPQLAATGYLLIDAKTGEPLVEFNAEQRLPPASLTKLMTSYVAAQEIKRGTISRGTGSVSVSRHGAWVVPACLYRKAQKSGLKICCEA